jgi:hypothetical protein
VEFDEFHGGIFLDGVDSGDGGEAEHAESKGARGTEPGSEGLLKGSGVSYFEDTLKFSGGVKSWLIFLHEVPSRSRNRLNLLRMRNPESVLRAFADDPRKQAWLRSAVYLPVIAVDDRDASAVVKKFAFCV